MRDFYLAFYTNEKLPPLVAEIGWTHNLVIIKNGKATEGLVNIPEKGVKLTKSSGEFFWLSKKLCERKIVAIVDVV